MINRKLQERDIIVKVNQLINMEMEHKDSFGVDKLCSAHL